MNGGRVKKSLILIAAALLFSSASLSQSFTSVGPYGGWINDLATDAAGNIYAATFVGGVFKTTDNGNTWVQIYNDTLIIDPRAIALNSSGHIFIGTSVQGFFRSTNGGISWQKLNNALNTTNVRTLLVPTNGDILAGCIPGGIYRSTDNGTTFTTINIGLTNTDVISLATKMSNGYLFAATDGGGVFRSTNAGADWSAINNGIPSPLQMNWVGVSPSGDIYTSSGLFLYRSTNNGDSWANVTAPATGYAEIAFAPNAMYAATYTSVVYKSTDGGTTWTQETGLPDISFLNVIASGTTIITGTAGLGTYRSNGTSSPSDTWTQVVNGMTNTHVVAIDEAPNGDLYAATLLTGVWRSTDTGLTWFSASNGIPPADQLFDLTVSPTTGTVFVSAIGLSARGYRSTNQGTTWINVASLYACTAVACNAQGHVFAGFGSAVRRSTNDGVTWTSSTPSTQIAKIADIAFERDTVYVATGVGSGFGTSRGVYRSTDNGNTWGEFNNGLTDLNVTTIAVRRDSSTLESGPQCPPVAAGTWGSGVLEFENGTWTTTEVTAQKIREIRGVAVGISRLDIDMLAIAVSLLYARRPGAACVFSILPTYTTLENLSGLVMEIPNNNSNTAGLVALIGTNGGGILRGTNIINSVGTEPAIPKRFLLEQNYPNPFNPSTKIVYRVKSRESVSLKVFDVLGREVATLVDEIKNPGEHAVTFDGGNLSSGVYFYKLRAGDFVETKKLVLLR